MSTPDAALLKAVAPITAEAMLRLGLTDERDAREVIGHTLEVARAWASGEWTLAEAAVQCSIHERWLAARYTRPMPDDFARMLDALIDAEGAWRTRQGVMTRQELAGVEARVVMEETDGVRRQVAHFPIAYPWLHEPDPKLADAGVRLDAVFRSERGPTFGEFSSAPLPGGGQMMYGEPRNPRRSKNDFWDAKTTFAQFPQPPEEG